MLLPGNGLRTIFLARQDRFSQRQVAPDLQFIKEHYGKLDFDCKHYDRLYEFMTHDKKNIADRINFTLLSDVGDIQINQSATKEEIMDMLDFTVNPCNQV